MINRFTTLIRGLALVVALAGGSLAAQAQGVGIGTTIPNASAALDVSSTTQGLLPPRMSEAQRNTINPASTAAGLTVFNTTTGVLNVWSGTQWQPMLVDSTPPTTFSYTGAPQTYTVPPNVTSLNVDLVGAMGGSYYRAGTGQGPGGRVQAVLAVTPGQVLTIYVGQRGMNNFAPAAYNGGGLGNAAGGGGGATDIRSGGTALTNRLLVAGGGGGGGDLTTRGGSGPGGAGGGLVGGQGDPDFGGSGGTQTAGGGGYASGTLGTGGAGNPGGVNDGYYYSGAGGGGYYGGGSGYFHGGGGGGSSYAGPSASAVTHTQGFRFGDGYATITPTPSTSSVPAPVLNGANITGVIKNQTTQQTGASFNVDGTGTVGGLLMAGSASITGNIQSSANIAVDAGNANTGTVANTLRFGPTNSGEAIGSKRNATGNQFGLDFYTTSTARMSITTGGNVGIGTTAPISRFSFGSTTTSANAAAGRLAIYEATTGTNFYGLGLVLNGAGNYGMGLWGGTNGLQPYNGAAGSQLPHLYLDQVTSNVGIGTISPAYAFHLGNGTTGSSAFGLLQGVFGQTSYLRHSRLMFNDPNFGMGAGNMSSSAIDADLYFFAYNGTDRDIRFMHTDNALTDPSGTGWTTDLMIKQGGNVGIGTIAPATKLDVNGNLRLAVRLNPSNTAGTYSLTSADIAFSIFKMMIGNAAGTIVLPAGGSGQVEGQELTIINASDINCIVSNTNTDVNNAVTLTNANLNGVHAVKYVWATYSGGGGAWFRVQ
ncbi:glycine-rich protein [Hymenobacter antarcticus]|uniref:receptor protein-tyrosine kinase n=1 Tax=Hymenobacter antarcticus TaxID=486270 RepID=A0ABP7QRV1_9BACT